MGLAALSLAYFLFSFHSLFFPTFLFVIWPFFCFLLAKYRKVGGCNWALFRLLAQLQPKNYLLGATFPFSPLKLALAFIGEPRRRGERIEKRLRTL